MKTKEEILGSANTITDYLGNEFDYYTEEQALSAMDAYAQQTVEEYKGKLKESIKKTAMLNSSAAYHVCNLIDLA